jgi:glycerol kinase
MSWDEELLKYFNIPQSVLPEVVNSNHIVGNLIDFPEIPLCAILGDQQSSLFGQGCLDKGKAKATYGTGCFVLLNTGLKPANIDKMLTTIAYTINGKTNYALEGSVFSACNTINWMQHNINLFEKVPETENMAYSVPDTDGVYFVPAFTGLGAPYWNSDAKGTIIGLTLNTKKEHIVRAGLESMAYNVKAILDEMKLGGQSVSELRVDGGGSRNNFLLQFQADMLNKPVLKNSNTEATAMGVIYMVLVATNQVEISDIKNMFYASKTFTSEMPAKQRQKLFNGWTNAVNRALNWDE